MPTLEDNIHSFMLKSCRPYNTTDIQTYLKSYGDYGKTELQRAIDKMVADGRLNEKVYGKQKVYLIRQSDLPVANPAELQDMDVKIKKLEEELKEQESAFQISQRELKAVKSQRSVEELREEIKKVKNDIADLEKEKKKSEGVKRIDPVKCKQIKEQRAKKIRKWKQTKRACMEVVNAVLENYPGSKKELFEGMKIQTDEDAGVAPPT